MEYKNETENKIYFITKSGDKVGYGDLEPSCVLSGYDFTIETYSDREEWLNELEELDIIVNFEE